MAETGSAPASPDMNLGAGGMSIQTGQATDKDPFGLMPVNWPDLVKIHPEAAVAHSGEFGTEGFYLVTLISPNVATIPGVQAFHLESLSTWESVQIDETGDGENGSSRQLVIIAEGANGYVRIVSEQAGSGFLTTLENSDYWYEKVGPNPIVVRLFFSSVPPPG
jgi:hypothetical protein